MMDNFSIGVFIAFMISEVLPFIKTNNANGILHFLLLVVTHLLSINEENHRPDEQFTDTQKESK